MTNLPRKTQLLSSFALTSVAENLKISKKSTISQYFSTTNCITECGNQTRKGICENCLQQPQKSLVILHDKITKLERRYDSVTRVNLYIKTFRYVISKIFINILFGLCSYASRVVDDQMKPNAFH